jgi:hypothetical protein
MDWRIRFEFEDGNYKIVSVDAVLKVETPYDWHGFGGYALVECDQGEVWGFVSKEEVQKILDYNPSLVETTAAVRVMLRAVDRGQILRPHKRNPLVAWTESL